MKLSKNKWKNITLSECCEFQRGVIYSTTDEVAFGGIGILRANNITLESNKLNFENLRLLRSDFKAKGNQRLRKNDILICTASGSLDHVGKVALAENDTDYFAGG